jgi:hypothetical protein
MFHNQIRYRRLLSHDNGSDGQDRLKGAVPMSTHKTITDWIIKQLRRSPERQLEELVWHGELIRLNRRGQVEMET